MFKDLKEDMNKLLKETYTNSKKNVNCTTLETRNSIIIKNPNLDKTGKEN